MKHDAQPNTEREEFVSMNSIPAAATKQGRGRKMIHVASITWYRVMGIGG